MATVSNYHPAEANPAERKSYPSNMRLFGIRVTPMSDGEVVLLAAEAIRTDQHIVVADQNLHGVYLTLRDEGLRSFYESAPYVYIDGMALVLLANLIGVRLRRVHRATSLDFMPILAPLMARESWRLFYLGGRQGNVLAGTAVMQKEYPGLQIRAHHGYVSDEDTPEVIREINNYRPHILMVGMGMPLQEKWIQRNHMKIHANVIFPVGAFIDYKAGSVPTPPRWLGSFYLEWAYRLFTEPRRLWYRYLIEPWMVIAGLLAYQLKNGRSPAEIRNLEPLPGRPSSVRTSSKSKPPTRVAISEDMSNERNRRYDA